MISSRLTLFATRDGGLFATEDKNYFGFGIRSVLILITDRTQLDVDRVNSFCAKGWNAMTDSERVEFESDMKGAYNVGDLNRVESAVETVAGLLWTLPTDLQEYADKLGVAWDTAFDLPYVPDQYRALSTRTDWTNEEIPDTDDMNRYLQNVVNIRAAFPSGCPLLPSSLEKLTYTGANAIERVLELVYEAVENRRAETEKKMDNTAAAWFFIGDIFGGEL